jgi:cytochrome c oxidase subunit 1
MRGANQLLANDSACMRSGDGGHCLQRVGAAATIYGLLRKYIFSTDHKVIGLQYAFTSMFFLLVGFALVVLIRWQLAYPANELPGWLASVLGEERAPSRILAPEFYNQLGAMYGTIMVFLGVVPLAFGAFGNYVVPLQIGAPDMAFPRLNMASYWAFFAGGARRRVSPAGFRRRRRPLRRAAR